jgi:anti-sigma B factor antagonist
VPPLRHALPTQRLWGCLYSAIFLGLQVLPRGRRIAHMNPDLQFAPRSYPMSGKIDKAGISIFVRREDVLACLNGCIDIDSSPAVRDRLLALLNAPHLDTVTIDLSAVTHVDSSGVATLIEAVKIARGCETELRLKGLDDRLRRLFEITGILSLFNGEQRNMNEFENKVV